jgi:hypothetical protein
VNPNRSFVAHLQRDAGTPPAGADAAASRVRRFIASTETPDRYNTTIKASGWQLENYTRNPIILWAHQRGLPPIGKGSVRIDGASLVADVTFFEASANPMAEQILQILDAGVLAVSVGFEPLEWVYNAERETGDEFTDMWFPPLDYTRAELHEISLVTVPGNAEALPIGRAAPDFANALKRFAPRIRARLDQIDPPPAPPAPTAPAAVDVRAMIARVVADETRAAVARATGNLGGKK